jgi:type IV pilus assembly protein PilY1
LWKFDLSSATASNWDVAYKSGSTNLPLITAMNGTTALPITTAPEFAYPPYQGLMITFGTGNAFEAGNYPNTSVSQRIYGVWDRPEFATGTRTLPASNASTLVSRTYARQSSGAVIVTSGATIDWTTKDGWYFNLPGSSEMVLSDPDIQAGVLAFTTVMAQTSSNVCAAKPDVASYAIDPITGKPERNIQGTTLVSTTTYLNAGVTSLDQKVRIVSDRTKRAFTKECRKGDPGCTCTTDVGGVETCVKSSTECPPGTSARRKIGQSGDAVFCYRPNGRMQWREIPGLRTDQ